MTSAATTIAPPIAKAPIAASSTSTPRAAHPAFADGASRCRLPDGRRWLLQHGPIDLVIEAWGEPTEVARAHEAAWQRFQPLLGELVGDLAVLRTPVSAANAVSCETARLMVRACARHAAAGRNTVFVTAMAAVAGAVADTILRSMTQAATLDRAYVNNGGDIAFHLTDGQSLSAGVVGNYDAPALDAFSTVDSAQPSRGLATSGWRGRSHSLGIADAVTVLARDAAAADVAATLIANAVTCDDPAIQRVPASDLAPDSDLGDRLVTVDVGPLAPEKVSEALAAGAGIATEMRDAGLIDSALLLLDGESRSVHRNNTISERKEA